MMPARDNRVDGLAEMVRVRTMREREAYLILPPNHVGPMGVPSLIACAVPDDSDATPDEKRQAVLRVADGVASPISRAA